ncbi:MAG: phosphoribosylanthranilate isomerase [Candidatus Omnitrophota bacterium]
MIRIKICGITNKEDAIRATGLKVDMLGFVFYKRSKRYVDPATVRDIANELPPSIGRVGVFVDESAEKVREIAEDADINMLQFHGDETPEYCAAFKDGYRVIKAFRLKDRKGLENVNRYDADLYLLDTYDKDAEGGTGKVFDWKIAEDYEFLKPTILSGGLDPKNVTRAIRTVCPYGVDVSSGVEKSPGKKDFELMKRFVEAVRKAE